MDTFQTRLNFNISHSICETNLFHLKNVFFVKQDNRTEILVLKVKKIETEMSTCGTDYLKICNSLIWKEWNMLFQKWATEIDVLFMKQASEKKKVASELWNSNHRKWNYNVSLWNWLFKIVKHKREK